MICSIHQPQSFPWLGFFAKIYSSDIFILLDNVQFKKNEFQNRNKIKINNEGKWLTIPVKYKFGQLVKEVEINNNAPWKNKHLKTLQNVYSKSEYFDEFFPEIEQIYGKNFKLLADFNIEFINWSLQKLSIDTKIEIASDLLDLQEIQHMDATEKLVKLTRKVNCTTYLSGKGGKNYLDENKFYNENFKILYQNFEHPIYRQQGSDFLPCMSILDLLFNEGPNSLSIIKKGIK